MSEGEIGGLSVKELCESLPEVRGDEISGCHKGKKTLYYFKLIIQYMKNSEKL